MKIAVLETGSPPEPLSEQFGDYPAMFEGLLRDAGSAAEFSRFNVRQGELPARPEDFDAYLITGSAAGVYDDLPWIEPLKAFLVTSKGKAKLVGVCFGHQIMAEAFGGRVIKSPKGWGVGLHRYDVFERAPWMDEEPAVAIPVSHQDQVVELPPAARVVAGSDFAPYGFLAYEDQPAISMQPHPEFDPAYAAALLHRRRGGAIAEDLADQALASLANPNDSLRVGGWIRRFLES